MSTNEAVSLAVRLQNLVELATRSSRRTTWASDDQDGLSAAENEKIRAIIEGTFEPTTSELDDIAIALGWQDGAYLSDDPKTYSTIHANVETLLEFARNQTSLIAMRVKSGAMDAAALNELNSLLKETVREE